MGLHTRLDLSSLESLRTKVDSNYTDFSKTMGTVTADAEKYQKIIGEALNTARQSTTAWRNKLPAGDVPLAIEQVRQWEGKLFSWLSPAWWRMRGVLRRSYNFDSHAVRPTWTQILTALKRDYETETAAAKAIRNAKTTFGIAGDPFEYQQRVIAIRTALQHAPEWLRRIHTALVKSSTAQSFVERTLRADSPTQELLGLLPSFMVNVDHIPLDKLRGILTDIQCNARHTPRVLHVLGELNALPKKVADTLRSMPLSVRQAEAEVLRRTWEELQEGDQNLNKFDERGCSRLVHRLEKAYDGWLSSNSIEIRRRAAEAFLEHVRVSNMTAAQISPEQRELKRRYSQGRRALEHEFGKTMRYRAIRELVDSDAALVIQDLKPIWLMSPLSVSDALPLDQNYFDVVIFDEASQVPLEESVPSLFRGRQVIVVGDEMQLPPTDFFAAKQTEEDNEELGKDGAQPVAYELESDSFLNHAAKNLPATMLGWHYRSRSESLISFSNWAFYDGRLLTVPEHRLLNFDGRPQSSDGHQGLPGVDLLLGRPLSFHYLANGRYDQRRNTVEAEYIATMIGDLLKGQTGQSIGVIAFSEAQQGEIELALNRLAQDDADFRALYEAELEREVDGQFVGLLVKNLENIQGDERDIIILSICYGPNPSGKMLMNFGPINKSGGEKRLNVAFSRAKQHMAVVSSIQSTAITNDYNEGANCLKNYLRYAEAMSDGDDASARRVLTSISRWRDSANDAGSEDDEVGVQLTAELRERGYLVDTNVGQSHFHVNLAVRCTEDSAYRLGILIDRLANYEQVETLERELLRPRLLCGFGWRVAKVLAKDWYNDRAGEFQRICDAIEGAGVYDNDVKEEDDDEADSEAPSLDNEEFDAQPDPLDQLDISADGEQDTDQLEGNGSIGVSEHDAAENSSPTPEDQIAPNTPSSTGNASRYCLHDGSKTLAFRRNL